MTELDYLAQIAERVDLIVYILLLTVALVVGGGVSYICYLMIKRFVDF